MLSFSIIYKYEVALYSVKKVDPSISGVAESAISSKESPKPVNKKIQALVPAIFSSAAWTLCYSFVHKKSSAHLLKVSVASFVVSYLCVLAFFKWKNSNPKDLLKEKEPQPSSKLTIEKKEESSKTESTLSTQAEVTHEKEKVLVVEEVGKKEVTNDESDSEKPDFEELREMIEVNPEKALPHVENLHIEFLKLLNKEKENSFIEIPQDILNTIKDLDKLTVALQKKIPNEKWKYNIIVGIKEQIDIRIEDLQQSVIQLREFIKEKSHKQLDDEKQARWFECDVILSKNLQYCFNNTVHFERFAELEPYLKEMVQIDPDYSIRFLTRLLASFRGQFILHSIVVLKSTPLQAILKVWEKVEEICHSLKLSEKIADPTTDKKMVKLYENTLKLIEDVSKKRKKIKKEYGLQQKNSQSELVPIKKETDGVLSVQSEVAAEKEKEAKPELQIQDNQADIKHRQERLKGLHTIYKGKLATFLVKKQAVEEMIDLDDLESALPYVEELHAQCLSDLNKEKEIPHLVYLKPLELERNYLAELRKKLDKKDSSQKLKFKELYSKIDDIKEQIGEGIADLKQSIETLKEILLQKSKQFEGEKKAKWEKCNQLLHKELKGIANDGEFFTEFDKVNSSLLEMVEMDPDWSIFYLTQLLHSFNGAFNYYCSLKDVKKIYSISYALKKDWAKVKVICESIKLSEKIANPAADIKLVKLYEHTLKLMDRVSANHKRAVG